jgi:hypothetical protein
MKYAVRLVVAFLLVVLGAGCNGQSPTSPTPAVVTPPTTPAPSGPVQLGELRGFSIDPFTPPAALGGGGNVRFDRTVDGVVEFTINLENVDDYNLVVIVFSHAPGDTSANPEVIGYSVLKFAGNSATTTVNYDGSKCLNGRCLLSLQNRSERGVPGSRTNMARVYGTPER